ncbi:DDE-type integrase/transposase/recombinase, partial [Thiolapillus sp.]
LRAENEEAQQAKHKTFKDYAPGFVHVDVKYLPQIADEPKRTYLFVAIDRATRWVYLEILPNKSARSAKGFLQRLIKKAPFIITKILTDNGKEFTDRFVANGERKPTGQHPFDQVCQVEDIEHRLIKPKHPQTNGMVERFNGRISEILATTHFDASKDLQETLYQYQKIYNYHVPQKNLGHITPIQALKNWYKKRPEIFKKKVYDLSELDS